MNKLFAVTLLIAIGMINLFPVCTSGFVMHAENAANTQNDAYVKAVKENSPHYTPYREQPLLSAAQSKEFSPSRNAGPGLNISREWMHLMYGSGIGATGLFAQDLTGDGTIEIVAGANSSGNFGNNFWYVLRQSGPNTYEHVWISGIYSSNIKQIAIADVNNDGITEIFVGFQDASVHVYRGTDFSMMASFPVKFEMHSMLLADADGNGSEELIIWDNIDIAAYNPSNFQLMWELSGYGDVIEVDLAVGNVDADATPEIVLSTGYVLNGATRAVEWHYTGISKFGRLVAVGDIDGDGIGEIIAGGNWDKISIFKADHRLLVAEFSTQNIDILILADVNGDNRQEILYGDDQWGAVHCVDGLTRNQLWQIENPEDGVTAIVVADVDQDSSLEILWGAGYSSSGADYIYVADILTGNIEWQSEDHYGPFSAVDIGDVDDDGQPEIVLASYSSNAVFADNAIKIFDAATHNLEWHATVDPSFQRWRGIDSIRIGDVDHDGETEFVIATYLDGGLIHIYNGRSHTPERSSKSYSGTKFTAMELGDVDGDGQTEIVVGQKIANTGANEVHIIVFNGATAEEEWQTKISNAYSGGVYDIHLEDVDGDSRVEIITSFQGKSVYVIDGVTHKLDAEIPTQAYSLTSSDLDLNGTPSILVGRDDGKVDIYNGKTYELEESKTLGSGAISCLSLADVDQNAVPEWLVCDQNRLSIYAFEDLGLLWRSGDLGDSLGLYNQNPTGQIDDDYDLEILLGSMTGVYQFEAPWSGPLGLSSMTVSPKTALPGDTLTYTVTVSNLGKSILTTVSVDNPLPPALNYVPNSLSVSKGTANYTTGKITWNGSLDPKSSIRLTYQVVLSQNAQRVDLLNSAVITSGSQVKTIQAMLSIPKAYAYIPVCTYQNCGNYFDDFQNSSSGWLVSDDEYSKTEYIDGQYRLLAKNTGYVYLIKAPTCSRQNYSVEVDARWDGTPGSGYGIIFGLADDFSQYYLFMINSDYGIYSLYYRGASGFEQISRHTYSTYIEGGLASNHMKVSRIGSQITLEINGNIEGSWTDARISGPTKVGLLNEPYGDLANADARFDNFRVTSIPVTTSSALDIPMRMPALQAPTADLMFDMQPFPDFNK